MYNGSNNSFRRNGQNMNNRRDYSSDQDVALPFVSLTIDNYVDLAEKVMDKMFCDDKFNPGQKKSDLTTSKIRTLLSMSAEILFKANNALANEKQTLTDDLKEDLGYFRIRCAYEMGREKSVKQLDKQAHLLEHVKNVKSISDCILFCHYLEALVAYHKYNGGKD